MTAERERLSNRHAHEVAQFPFEGILYTATLARFDDHRPAELFLAAGVKHGSTLQHHLDVASIAISLALQHGVSVEALRHAIKIGAIHQALGLFEGSLIKAVVS